MTSKGHEGTFTSLILPAFPKRRPLLRRNAERNSTITAMGDSVRVQELNPATQQRLKDLYNVEDQSELFARYGDAGYMLSASYKEDADHVRNMAVRPDDVWVTTFPRSGYEGTFTSLDSTGISQEETTVEKKRRKKLNSTTLTQELVWLLKNDFDYETASKMNLMSRYMYIDLNNTIFKQRTKISHHGTLANTPSPRYLKTHMPFSLLPATLLDTAKAVYVARDPRDVAVSFYHFEKLYLGNTGDLKTYWNNFINDLVLNTPFFSHVKEAWALRHHPNLLFIFYEDLLKDMPSSIKRIADFYGKEVTNDQIAKLRDHLQINNFRKNESVIPRWLAKLGKPEPEGFIRKGKAGGWREYFDEEMAAQAQQWLRENLAGSDLRFPQA